MSVYYYYYSVRDVTLQLGVECEGQVALLHDTPYFYVWYESD